MLHAAGLFARLGGAALLVMQAPLVAGLRPAPAVAGLMRPNSSSQCSSVTFLRIQKTGSTTLGEGIMPQMCPQNHQTCAGRQHLEYNHAKTKFIDSCVITMVRDPLERFMSEFAMALSKDAKLLTQDQWDFAPQDVPWLESVKTRGNSTETLLEYLQNPNNPSRNRQTLYLLGFERVGCQPPRSCCGVCSASAGYPAHAYDWDRDRGELLARAKEHLMSLTAFGVTDWFGDSMKVLAAAVGWNEKDTVTMSEKLHQRQANKQALLTSLVIYSLHPRYFQKSAMSDAAAINRQPWRDFISPELERKIRGVNSVDNELVAFARQQLHGRYKGLFN